VYVNNDAHNNLRIIVTGGESYFEMMPVTTTESIPDGHAPPLA